MRKRNVFFVFFFLLIFFDARSQCHVTAFADTLEICVGESVQIWGEGSCGMLMSNNFNNGTPGAGWTATTGVDFTNPCGPGPNLIYLWMGHNVPIPRTLTTVPFDVSAACEISFWMRFGIQSDPSPCEGPDLVGEGVSLQYSVNNGATWTDIAYFRPDGVICPSYPNTTGFTTVSGGMITQFTQWAQYTFNVPPAAASNATRFRWIQHAYTSQVYDHWGLDLVDIICPGTTDVLWNTGHTSLDTFIVSPPVTTTYIVTVYDSINGYSATDSVTVVVYDIPTPPVANGITIHCGDTAVLTASGGSTGIYGWYSDPGGNNQIGTGSPFSLGNLTHDTIIYVASLNGPCPSTLVPVPVTVLPLDDPLANGVTINCGDSAILTVSGSSGFYQWFSDPQGNNLIDSGSVFTTGVLTQDTVFYVASSAGTGASEVYNFSACGGIGSIGPTQAQANTAYAGTLLQGQVTVNQGIQQWTVPQTGTYTIEVAGAQGYGSFGGRGALMKGNFDLTAGTVLKILVGQQGAPPISSSNQYGGGGGSFVTLTNNSPLIVAGGGGGSWGTAFDANGDGNITPDGSPGTGGTTNGAAGIGGNGGATASSADGGGGLTGNGGGTTGGRSFTNGGAGGVDRGHGGFGGGGGTSSWDNRRGGGGGGYSGGGGSSASSSTTGYPVGGGGGSYNSGTTQENLPGANTGDGYIAISFAENNLCFSNIIPVPVTVLPIDEPLVNSPVTICMSDSVTLTVSGSTGNYNWYDDPAGTNLIATGSSYTTPVLTTTTTYYVEAVSATTPVLETYSFSHCAAVGSIGPTQAQVNAAYAGTLLDGQVSVNQGIQQWTVPQTGTYSIELAGAQGYGGFGGRGAVMKGDFNLTAGTTLKILVGQKGAPPISSNNQYGGGGGSFVTLLNNTPLIVAGGGGGSWATAFNANSDGNIIPDGSPGTGGTTNGTAGTGGNGGGTASSADGGGGITGNGGGTTGGSSFTNGGAGGVDRGHGGFGGGGGTSSWDNRRSGGGGGYSGGGGAAASSSTTGSPAGGGGGSYNSGTNQVSQAGVNTGDGYVTISYTLDGIFCSSNLVPVTVIVDSIPDINLSAGPPNVCLGDQTALSATSNVAGTSYLWNQGIGLGSDHVVQPGTTTTYTVTATTPGGCSATEQITIQVFPAPTVTASATVPMICEGDVTTLEANSGLPLTDFTWSNGLGTGNSHIVSPTTTTTYTVTGTDANGCSDTASVTVNVEPNPVINITPSAPHVCTGNSVTLIADGASQYNWSNALGAGASHSVSPLTTTTYAVTGTNQSGCSGTASVTVSVSPDADITVTPAAPSICSGTSVTITANGGSTYLWSGGLGAGASQTVSPVANTTYTVTGTDANGCSGTASATVTVNPDIVVSITPSSPQLCSGASVTITAGGGDFYDWSGGLGQGASQTVSPTTTTTYTVTGTDVNGCSGTSAVTVNVIPDLVITVTPAAPQICIGNSVNITAAGASNYVWSGGLGSAASHSVSPATTTTYTVTGTDANGCSGTATVTVTVNQNANITINPSSPQICSGASVTISAGGGNTYNWSGGLGTSASQTVSPASTTTYTVTGTDANGCSGTASATVSVHPDPVISITPSSSDICQGESVTITAAGGNSYNWSGGLGAGVSHTVSPAATTTYTVTSTDVNGCTATSSVNITVNIAAITASSDIPGICDGGIANLTAGGGNTYEWSDSLGQGASHSVSPSVSTTYTVTGTDANGCTGTAQVHIEVFGDLTVSINPNSPVICLGDDAQLTASAGGSGADFIWNTGQNIAIVTVSPQTTTDYIVTASDALGCTGSAEVTVTVEDLPLVNFEAQPLNGCVPLTVSFTNLSDPGTYQWTFGNGASSGNTNPVYQYTNSGVFTVTLTVTSPNGCVSTMTVPSYIEVYPKPDAAFISSVEGGVDSWSLVSFTDQSTGAVNWLWDFGSGGASSTEQHPEYQYSAEGEYTVWLHIANQWGCTDSTSHLINIRPVSTIYIPNAFTPNGDGVNDYFHPYGNNIDPDDYQMLIFNRWGMQIFRSDNLNTPWDGRSKAHEDKMAPQGVYVYLITARVDGVLKTFEGIVTLVQ